MGATVTQEMVGVKEAARLMGASVKRVRRAIKRGEIRADLRPGRWGMEWQIERASLPEAFSPPADTGHTRGGEPGADQALTFLRDELRSEQARHASALLELGRLHAVDADRKLLAARAESLLERVATERARAESFAGEGKRLRSALRARTWSLAIVLAAFALAVAAAIVRIPS